MINLATFAFGYEAYCVSANRFLRVYYYCFIAYLLASLLFSYEASSSLVAWSASLLMCLLLYSSAIMKHLHLVARPASLLICLLLYSSASLKYLHLVALPASLLLYSSAIMKHLHLVTRSASLLVCLLLFSSLLLL